MTHLDLVYRSVKSTECRSVCIQGEVHPGTYIILPSTFECDTDGTYLLRIFIEKRANPTVKVYVI